MEEDGQEAEVVSLGASRSVPPVWKSSKLHCYSSVILSYCSDDQTSFTRNMVYVDTRSNMHVAFVFP